MTQVPKNNKFRKTRNMLDKEDPPKKEVEPIAPNSEADSQQNILYRNTNLNPGSYPPSPTKPGSVHRRVPADQAIPTQHPGAVRGQKQK